MFLDVARMGPSTGLPTRTSQGDVELCARASHGDTLHICLYPGTMEECFQFTYQAFDLAERFQTPVFVVSDLDLGMQNWASRPFAYPEGGLGPGQGARPGGPEAGIQDWGRYKDPDGDGIPWRTLPGTPGGKGAYFTRGTGHNVYGLYSEKPEDFQLPGGPPQAQIPDRQGLRAQAACHRAAACPRGILAYGSSHPAVVEARDILREEHGKDTDYLRVRALPFTDEVIDFIRDPRGGLPGGAEPRRPDGGPAQGLPPGAGHPPAHRAALRQHRHPGPDHRRPDQRLRDSEKP